MSERDDGAFAVPFGQMDEAEIIAHFERYGFTDELGHALELCADFFGFGALCQAGRCVNAPAKKSPAFGRGVVEV